MSNSVLRILSVKGAAQGQYVNASGSEYRILREDCFEKGFAVKGKVSCEGILTVFLNFYHLLEVTIFAFCCIIRGIRLNQQNAKDRNGVHFFLSLNKDLNFERHFLKQCYLIGSYHIIMIYIIIIVTTHFPTNIWASIFPNREGQKTFLA